MGTNLKITKGILILLLLMLVVWSFVDPPYPEQLLLQHSGTALILIFLAIDFFRNRWRFSMYFGVALFAVLHVVGAKYIYSFVPYNDWILELFGFDLNETMGYERNHYDRFVHFSFGVLLFPVVFHFAMYKSNKKVLWSILISWLSIQTFSMFYEIFEWGLTVFLSGEAATNYNGQQGDVWDPQKDMALALLGSSLMGLFYLLKYKVLRKSF